MTAAELLREIAAPIDRDEKIGDVIARTARVARLSYSRCFELWYGRARKMDSEEAAQLEGILAAKRKTDTRNDIQKLRVQLAQIEARLSRTDEEFYRPTIDLVGQTLRRSR